MSQSDRPDGPPFPTKEVRQLQGSYVQADSTHTMQAVNFFHADHDREPDTFEIDIPKGTFGQIDGASRLTDRDGQLLPDEAGATVHVRWSDERFPNGPVMTEYANQTDFARDVTVQSSEKSAEIAEAIETANSEHVRSWLDETVGPTKEPEPRGTRWWEALPDRGDRETGSQPTQERTHDHEQDYER